MGKNTSLMSCGVKKLRPSISAMDFAILIHAILARGPAPLENPAWDEEVDRINKKAETAIEDK